MADRLQAIVNTSLSPLVSTSHPSCTRALSKTQSDCAFAKRMTQRLSIPSGLLGSASSLHLWPLLPLSAYKMPGPWGRLAVSWTSPPLWAWAWQAHFLPSPTGPHSPPDVSWLLRGTQHTVSVLSSKTAFTGHPLGARAVCVLSISGRRGSENDWGTRGCGICTCMHVTL